MLNLLEALEGGSAMDGLWAGITSAISNIMKLIATVTTGLLSNEIFQIVIGVVVFMIIMGIVFALVRKVKRRG